MIKIKSFKLYEQEAKESSNTSENEITCDNCSWNWKIEADDNRKHLCHKCGYDNKLKDFDIKAFEEWKKKYHNGK